MSASTGANMYSAQNPPEKSSPHVVETDRKTALQPIAPLVFRHRRRNWFCGLLTIVFNYTKLTKVICWSWLWVVSPLWIGALLTLIITVIAVIISLKS